MGTQKSPVFVRANRFFQTMYLNTQTPPGWLAPTIALGNWVWSNITFFLKKNQHILLAKKKNSVIKKYIWAHIMYGEAALKYGLRTDL